MTYEEVTTGSYVVLDFYDKPVKVLGIDRRHGLDYVVVAGVQGGGIQSFLLSRVKETVDPPAEATEGA